MKLITKQRPLSYLWIIVIEVILGIGMFIGGVAIDLAIYDPPKDQPGFPFPLFTIMFMFFAGFVIAVSLIIVIIRRIYLLCKQKPKQ